MNEVQSALPNTLMQVMDTISESSGESAEFFSEILDNIQTDLQPEEAKQLLERSQTLLNEWQQQLPETTELFLPTETVDLPKIDSAPALFADDTISFSTDDTDEVIQDKDDALLTAQWALSMNIPMPTEEKPQASMATTSEKTEAPITAVKQAVDSIVAQDPTIEATKQTEQTTTQQHVSSAEPQEDPAVVVKTETPKNETHQFELNVTKHPLEKTQVAKALIGQVATKIVNNKESTSSFTQTGNAKLEIAPAMASDIISEFKPSKQFDFESKVDSAAILTVSNSDESTTSLSSHIKLTADAPSFQSLITQKSQAQMHTMTTQFGDKNWSNELSDKLQVLASHDIKSARLVLHPKELGTIEAHIKMVNDKAEITLASQHASVRDAMEHAVPRLKDMFDQSQMNLSRVSIGEQTQSQQGNASQQQRSESNHAASEVNHDKAKAQNTTQAHSPIKHSDNAVDYYA